MNDDVHSLALVEGMVILRYGTDSLIGRASSRNRMSERLVVFELTLH